MSAARRHPRGVRILRNPHGFISYGRALCPSPPPSPPSPGCQAHSKMPLTAKHTWVESETTVQLQVPLKGQPISKVDVFGETARLLRTYIVFNDNRNTCGRVQVCNTVLH